MVVFTPPICVQYERVNTTIFETNSKKKLMKLILMDLPNQVEHFRTNRTNVKLMFAQKVVKM